MSKYKHVREMTDDDLIKWTSGWKVGTADYIAGMAELKRRQEKPNRKLAVIAIWISGAAALVSIIGVVVAVLN